jgi:hypothetical protein
VGLQLQGRTKLTLQPEVTSRVRAKGMGAAIQKLWSLNAGRRNEREGERRFVQFSLCT